MLLATTNWLVQPQSKNSPNVSTKNWFELMKFAVIGATIEIIGLMATVAVTIYVTKVARKA